jgi:hypothetical protein
MKYALIDGQRYEAQSGCKGVCISCGSPTVARCGEVRVNHWAHLGQRRCDSWWENETDWHRAWKNNFPSLWQEIVHTADNGEKHIADVKTNEGWVLEFQHSYIKPEERRSREDFYKKLIWVVDGNRRIKDKKRFFEIVDDGTYSRNHPNLRSTFPEGALFRDWINSTAHVMFDFGDDELWWLSPLSNESHALVLPITRRQFIQFHIDDLDSSPNRFEAFFKNYDLKPPDPYKAPPIVPAIDVGNIHPNTFLGLMNNRRRSRF